MCVCMSSDISFICHCSSDTLSPPPCITNRVSQNCTHTIFTPYMIVYLVIWTNRVGQNRIYTHRIWPYIWWFSRQKHRVYTVYIGLARTAHTHTVYDRIFGDFPAQSTVYTPYMTVYLAISLPKYRIYTVYVCFWANFWPTLTTRLMCRKPHLNQSIRGRHLNCFALIVYALIYALSCLSTHCLCHCTSFTKPGPPPCITNNKVCV
jgi:hypothetical protein